MLEELGRGSFLFPASCLTGAMRCSHRRRRDQLCSGSGSGLLKRDRSLALSIPVQRLEGHDRLLFFSFFTSPRILQWSHGRAERCHELDWMRNGFASCRLVSCHGIGRNDRTLYERKGMSGVKLVGYPDNTCYSAMQQGKFFFPLSVVRGGYG